MLKSLLLTQWKSSRIVIALAALLAFALPLGSVLYGGALAVAPGWQVANWLNASRIVGAAIPYVALGTGVILGMVTWAPDHAGRHVYALSLPVPRAQYVLMRYGSGLILLAAPVAALLASSLIATAAVNLPAGVHAYPFALTGRFALTLLLSYALFFAISIATRKAVLLTFGLIGGVLLSDLLLAMAEQEATVTVTIFEFLTRWPGPLALLLGRWALFDV
jgi:hypothetical protein